jgi:hypothetical protein
MFLLVRISFHLVGRNSINLKLTLLQDYCTSDNIVSLTSCEILVIIVFKLSKTHCNTSIIFSIFYVLPEKTEEQF